LWFQKLNYHIPQERISTHSMEIQDSLKGIPVALVPDKMRQGSSDGVFGKIPLPEDRQDVLGPGSRRLPQQVMATNSLEILADGQPGVPAGEKSFRVR